MKLRFLQNLFKPKKATFQKVYKKPAKGAFGKCRSIPEDWDGKFSK